MSLKYLNLTGLSRVITNLKNWVVSQIPTKTSEITNDSGFLTSHQSLDGKMTRGSYERIEGNSSNHKDLNDYITAGFYNVKTAYVDNCPTGIERDAALLVYPWNAGSYCTQEITETAASTHSRRWIRKLNNTTWSDWVAVAFHGDNLSAFNNDSGFITSSSLPTVNNATLTIQKNGTNVQTFTANASSNKTANITVPTAVSELTNDSGFITSSSLPTVNNATLTIQKNGTTVKTFTANASSNVTCNITVPTKTSELTNDSSFLTSHQAVSNSAPTLAWGTTSTIGTVGGTNLTVTMPANPNTDTDTKVTQTVTNNSNAYYPLLFCNTAKATATETSGAKFYSGVAAHARYGYLWLRNLYDTDNLKGSTAGGTRTCGGVRFNTYNDVEAGRIWNEVLASGLRRTYIRTTNYITDGALSTTGSAVHNSFTLNVTETGAKTQTIEGGWACNLIPAATHTHTLGTSSLAWKGVYANSYYLGTTAFGDIVTHNASEFLTAHQSLSNYSTLANTIKSLSISGRTITYTKGDNTTGTLTTQDNNTWTAMVGATSSANGSVGYVNAVPPKDGYNTKFLRADGTWAVPPDHTYTVNNATLTIQKNGSNVATFTSNASSNVTANIAVPTKTSELTNDSGFLTNSDFSASYVTLNTQQNISANKFFYGGAWRIGSNYPSFICKNNAHTVGEAAPSSMWGYGEFLIQDKNAYSVCLLSCRYDQNATQYFRIECRNKFTNGAPAVDGTAASSVLDVGTLSNGTPYVYWNSYISNGLVPRLAFTWDIGDANHFWNRVYAAHYKIKGPNTQIGVTTSNSTVDFIDFIDANNTQVGYIGRWQHNNGYSCINLTCYDKYDGAGNRSTSGTVANGTLEIGTTNTGVPYLNYNTYFMQNISPLTNDNNDLGDASHHWRNLFIGEMHCYHQNALMAKSGGYTFLLRNDGSYIWFLISEANGNEGTWSGLRPLYINCASGACTSTSKWTFDKSFGDGDPSVLIQSGTAYANGTWNYPLAALAPNMKAGANLFMPIGRNFAAGNCAGWHFHYAGNNSNDNCLTTEFYAVGSPLAVYRDGRVVLSASPAASDNSTRVATTAFVKAQGYTTSAASKKLVLLAERSEAGTWTITCDTLKPIYFKFTASKNDSNAEFVVGIDGSSTCRLVNVNYGYSTNQFSYQVTSTSSGGQATWGIGVPTSSTITVSVWLRNTQFQRYFNIKAYQ